MLLRLGDRARLGSVGRAAAAALAVAMLLAGCAASSGQSNGPGDPADPGSSTAAATGCGRDEVMSRPCPKGAPKVAQRHRPRYKTDQGDSVKPYQGTPYRGQPYEYCKRRLRESFQAYKACVRY